MSTLRGYLHKARRIALQSEFYFGIGKKPELLPDLERDRNLTF
jgi:hypothetical protein